MPCQIILISRKNTTPYWEDKPQFLQAVQFWEFFKCLRTLGGHSREISSVAISEDGQTLVSGSWGNRFGWTDPIKIRKDPIKIWHLVTGDLIKTLYSNSGWVSSVAISADGQTFVSASYDKTIDIWHLATGEWIRTLYGHSDYVDSVAISPDGKTIVSGSEDNTIKIWGVP